MLEKKRSVKIKLPLLTNYNLEKGHYNIEVALHPPAGVCHLCDQMKEIYADFDFWVR